LRYDNRYKSPLKDEQTDQRRGAPESPAPELLGAVCFLPPLLVLVPVTPHETVTLLGLKEHRRWLQMRNSATGMPWALPSQARQLAKARTSDRYGRIWWSPCPAQWIGEARLGALDRQPGRAIAFREATLAAHGPSASKGALRGGGG